MPWPQIIMMVASFVLNYAMQPKPKPPKAAAFEDFDFPQVEEGTSIYVIFGDVWMSDWMVLTSGNFRTSKIQTKGGKQGIGGWVPGIMPGTTNPIENWFSPSEELGLGLRQYDPFQPIDPDNSLPPVVGGSTWIS